MKKLLALIFLMVSLSCQAQVSANSPLLTASQQTTVKVYTVPYAASVAVPFTSASFNVLTLTGNVTLTTANRPTVANQGKKIFLVINGDSVDRVVTLNGSWKVYGTNATSFTVLANKQAFAAVTATGSTESTVIFAYEHSQ